MMGRIIVIGSGLIGGSIIKRLGRSGAVAHLAVIDAEPVLARVRGQVGEVAVTGSPAATRLVQEAELVVLACPVGAIISMLPQVLDDIAEHAVVTDTGSSKRAVLEAASSSPKRRRFVAGHPMAGRELGGFDTSDPALFEGARWFLVSQGLDVAAAPDPDALTRVQELVRALGAHSQPCDADAHDRAMAYVSHMPQLISSAVHGAAAKAGAIEHAGPGFRDLTRIAGGPVTMWRDIFATNRAYLAEALGALLGPLVELLRALEHGEPQAIDRAIALLEEAQASKAQWHAAAQASKPRECP